jgi:predicted dehydrogenase/threonine dehydrogenase-like Zn-dependent dehydrogenase
MNRLDAPQPLGYASAGVVEDVGEGVISVSRGDRVSCAGAGYANHAEMVAVPENLVVRVPAEVSLDEAAFATLGAIAMQGLRVIGPELGEVGVVVGLGLIGQIAVQLLLANGCRILAVDFDGARVDQATDQGAEWGASPNEDFDAWKGGATAGHGADFVLVTAASDSSAPIDLATQLSRHRGRIGIVGATAMDLDRRSFYEKELQLRMSMSYGPGRYDRSYEESGLDYPYAYVRWTERRNLESFLALVARGVVAPSRLETRQIPFDEAVGAYEDLAKGRQKGLAFVFRYDPVADQAVRDVEVRPRRVPKAEGDVGIAVLGAGNYATSVLLPAIRGVSKIRRRWIVDMIGPSGQRTADRFKFERAATDPNLALDDPDVDLVFIATRHDSHARLAEEALEKGKAVWLEKPAALHREELSSLLDTASRTGGFFTVGYNRRFSEHARIAREGMADRRGPAALSYVVHAGPVPAGTWIVDPVSGGGRLIGEVCHFIDFATFLIGRRPRSVFARALGRDPQVDDSVILSIDFEDGSIATIHYLANASVALPKERWEISSDGRTISCDNFRTSRVAGGSTRKTANQDKGQTNAIAEVIRRVRDGSSSPISLDEIATSSLVSMAALKSIGTGASVPIERLPDLLADEVGDR